MERFDQDRMTDFSGGGADVQDAQETQAAPAPGTERYDQDGYKITVSNDRDFKVITAESLSSGHVRQSKVRTSTISFSIASSIRGLIAAMQREEAAGGR